MAAFWIRLLRRGPAVWSSPLVIFLLDRSEQLCKNQTGSALLPQVNGSRGLNRGDLGKANLATAELRWFWWRRVKGHLDIFSAIGVLENATLDRLRWCPAPCKNAVFESCTKWLIKKNAEWGRHVFIATNVLARLPRHVWPFCTLLLEQEFLICGSSAATVPTRVYSPQCDSRSQGMRYS